MTVCMKKPYVEMHVIVLIMLTAYNADITVCFAFLCCSLFRMVLVAQKMLISLAVTLGCS